MIDSLLRDPLGALQFLILMVPGFLVAVTVHEVAHGWVAERLGIRRRASRGGSRSIRSRTSTRSGRAGVRARRLRVGAARSGQCPESPASRARHGTGGHRGPAIELRHGFRRPRPARHHLAASGRSLRGPAGSGDAPVRLHVQSRPRDLQPDPASAARRRPLPAVLLSPPVVAAPGAPRAVRSAHSAAARLFRRDALLHRSRSEDSSTCSTSPLSGRSCSRPRPRRRNRRRARISRSGPFVVITPATTYSPVPLPAQYHRPWRA